MSYINSRRFTILSSNINTSNDVFDRLINVRDSVTGEEGVLLCSHMCSFPSNLVNQATLLAGCKPTSKWENDDRLALGFHPDHYIQWRVFKETNEIELYLTGGWSTNNYVEDGWEDYLFTDLPFTNQMFGDYENELDYYTEHSHELLFSKSLIRLAKSVLLDRVTSEVTQETLNNFECLIHRLFNSGRIDAWTASVFPSSMLTRCLHRDVYVERIHWQGDISMFFETETWIIETGEHLECTLVPYIDGGYQSKIEVLFQQQYTLSDEFYTQREEVCSSLPLTDRNWYSRQVF
jgi:hypothetical protein